MGLTSHRNSGWILVEISESGLSVLRDCGQAPKVVARALGVPGRGTLTGWWIMWT